MQICVFADTEAIVFVADPENKIGAKLPVWLDVIIEKYKTYNDALAANSSGGRTPAITKGKLACFVSVCLFGKIPCTKLEREAIVEVYCISIAWFTNEFRTHQSLIQCSY